MDRQTLIMSALLLGAVSLHAADEVELTGTYELQVSCYETYHEETAFIVEPGKDKFSGVRHAVHIPNKFRKGLRIGMRVRITGKKQPVVKKAMTKAEIRKAMYSYLKTNVGMPLYCKEMDEIISKISVKLPTKGTSGDAHDHGDFELKAVADDAEEVDVTIESHILVESIEILK